MARRQVISCPWQDEQGNVLALGTIVFEASGDAVVALSGELCAGIKGSLQLDVNGTVAASPAQYMWPTDQMNPANITYTVWVYSAVGELAWGPNYNLTVPSGAGSFNLCNWVPNSTGGGGGGAVGSILLQTNGVNNADQQVENLISGTGITLVADSMGGTTISSSAVGLSLEVNGTPNASQTLLNLQNGTNITITDAGSGNVTISAGSGNGPRTRFWHGWTYAGGATSVTPSQGFGCTPSSSVSGTFTSLAPTATEPNLLGMSSGPTGGFAAYISDTAGALNLDQAWTFGILGLSEHKVMLGSTTSVRYWVGMQFSLNTVSPNPWKSDTPTAPTAAFRYSTHASDTHWQCLVTDGTTQLVVDSGITPDATTTHTYGISFSAPNVLFYIDGTLVGTVAISTTTLTTSSLWNGFMWVDNVGAANNKVLYMEGYYWDTTP